jgi:hypothetical protein
LPEVNKPVLVVFIIDSCGGKCRCLYYTAAPQAEL